MSMSYSMVVLVATGMGYGWCLQKKVHIAAPLVLQFISKLFSNMLFSSSHSRVLVGALSMAVMNPTQTLILDLMPGQGSSVTACVSLASQSIRVINLSAQNNIVRCLLGAVAVSVIDIILSSLGPGFTYVLLNGIIVISMPLLYLVMKLGPRFRKKRREADVETLVAHS